MKNGVDVGGPRETARRDEAREQTVQLKQERCLQAHYAEAVPLALPKSEQDRILGELDQIRQLVDAHHREYTDARARLDNALNLMANCADIKNRCDDSNRHLSNQAFFPKV
ncbi:hypothetical protein GCM10009670_05990 [Citricoccus alkalitolerans]